MNIINTKELINMQIHTDINKLSASILLKTNNNISSLQITEDITQELLNFDDVKLTSYLSYIESQNINTNRRTK